MRRSLNTGIVGCSAVAVFILAGCGGGSDSTSDGAISQAHFLKQGNAICEKHNAVIDRALRLLSKGEGKPSAAAQARFAAVTVVPNIEEEIASLQSLSYPSQDEEAMHTFIAEAETALREVKKDPGVLANGSGPFASADKFATTYGLSACGFTIK